MPPEISEVLCRVCLKQDELMVDIYEHVDDQQTDLCTLLERCGDIKVDKSDNYPKLLCQECTKELLISAKFRAKCASTEQTLRESQLQCINEEVAAVAIIELASEELVVEDYQDDIVDEQDIITYDPSEHVELYEECETALPNEAATATVKKATEANAFYNCDDCGAVFQQAATLQRHIAKAHDNAATYDCNLCGHSFTQNINLQRHSCAGSLVSVPAMDIRVAQVSYRCQHCGKCLQSASSLCMHLRLHSGERPFACDVCPKTFKTNSGLVTHQKRHLKLMQFECEYCGKGFVESSNLRRHVAALHTAERPHTCTTCQRTFARVYLLELHMRTHTGERPYACSLCDSSFAQLGVLRTHERIHTGERRHRCGRCQKTFSRIMQLKKHELKPCIPVDSVLNTCS